MTEYPTIFYRSMIQDWSHCFVYGARWARSIPNIFGMSETRMVWICFFSEWKMDGVSVAQDRIVAGSHASANHIDLEHAKGLERVRDEVADDGGDIALILALGDFGRESARLMIRRLRHVGFHASLPLTSTRGACAEFVHACAYSSRHMHYDPKTFRMPIISRVYWLYRLFRAGVNVMVMDTDVIVRRNPFQLLRSMPQYSMIGAIDELPYNSGLFYARHVDSCTDSITEAVLREYARRCVEWGGFEQSVLIDVMSLEGMTSLSSSSCFRPSST